jgi:hypothetical protein
MRMAFAVFLALHGLIHLLGVAKAFGVAELPQLTQPISPVFGTLWLTAALLFVGSAVAVLLWPRGWWALGICGVLVSSLAIVPVWSDAKFGAAANAIVLIGILIALR